MKKRLNIIVALLFITVAFVTAQPFDYNQTIPTDTAIRIGKLSNGMKYYIKRNTKPEKRMEMRLAVNAGSVLEDGDQLGLAHFTEHMCFNGTKNFPKNELISFLQTLGVRFGADINAYTSFNETVYMLQIPTDKPDLIESGFKTLQDWAQNVTFDSLEIEKERGVVIEEWRLGRGADQRMEDKYLPVIFYKSQYADRLPIGNKESLEKFSRKSLTRFYKEWYRPDLMAVSIVGDFDVTEMEQKIKQHFGQIIEAQKPRPRKEFRLPSHKETLYSINSDKEANMTSVSIYIKSDPKKEKTIGDYLESAEKQLYFIMLNQRLGELTQTENPPFIEGFAMYGDIGARSRHTYISGALVSDTGILTGLKTILIENEKVKRFGFTQSELERAKLTLVNNYEKYYNERDKSESSQFADEFIRNFLTDEPIPGITFEYNIMKHFMSEVKLVDVNNLALKWVTDSNRVVVVTAPKHEGLKLPTEAELKKVVEGISKTNIKAYTENVTASELIANKPIAGKVVSQKEIKEVGVTELVLSNGVKVVLKPTEFKNDEVLLTSISAGGQSLYPDADYQSAKFATDIIEESGIGNFSIIDLKKMLAGKNISVTPAISVYNESMKANCVPRDMETMFQLMYLYFTAPRTDETAFQSWTSRIKSYLKNISSEPQVYYSDQLAKIMSQNNPRGGGVPTEADIDKINLNRVIQIYKERFANAADFTFTIVGNFTIDSIKPLLEQYVASLPATKDKEIWKDLGIRPPKGKVVKDILKGSDPKSLVTLVYTDTTTYNSDAAYYLSSLEDLLDIRLVEVLREDKSGVYTLRASASMNRIPYNSYNVTFKIPCAPQNADSLVSAAITIVNEIKEKGVSDVNLKKVKETQEREFEVSSKTNGFWISYLENSYYYNDDLQKVLKKKERIEKLTGTDIQNVTKKYFGDNYIKVTLLPEK